MPKKDSDSTADYDIYLLEYLSIKPNEIKKLITGLKSYFNKDEVLLIVVRNSMVFKYNIRLCNQIGVINEDYYNNKDNEAHMWIKTAYIPKGEAIAQGIFFRYPTTDSDEKDEVIINKKTTYYYKQLNLIA